MADFDILYPKNERQGFDGGKNNKFEKHLISDNETPQALNVIFDAASVETRPGVSRINSTSVGSFAGLGLYTRHDRSGAQSMCAWFNNGTMYTLGTNTFVTVPSAQSVFTAGARVGSAEYENYIFFGNGSNDPYKYNSHFTRHGIFAPTTTMIVASQAVGVVNGPVSYRLTAVNSNLVESDVGPVTTTFTAANGTLRVSAIQTFALSFGVERRKLYRTTNSGATYLLVTTLADNTTTTYDDNIADAALGAAAPTDQGTPPLYSTIITHQNRLFCNDTAEPSLVWWSEIGNPYVFKATNFEQIGDDSGDLVRGFAIHDNGLVVLTDKSAFLIYMPSADDTSWEVVKLKSPYGSRSPYGIFSYNNKQMFPAVQSDKLVGFAAISGDAVDPEATLLTVSAAGSDMKSERIEPDIFDIQSVGVSRISSQVFKNKAYITVTFGDGQTTNNRIYVFDFSIANLSKTQEASWVPWTGLAAEQFTVYNGKLYYIASSATGFAYEMNKPAQYNDDGTAIDSYFWTKEFSGNPGDEQYHKDFRYFNMLYEKPGDYFMDVTYRVDSDRDDGTTISVDLNPGGALFGTAVFDIDVFGGGNEADEDRIYLGQLRGKRIQFRFSNQNVSDQKFKVIGLQYSYNRKGRR